MSRIFKSLLALACVVIWCGTALATSTPKYRMRDMTRPTVDARSYVLPQANNGRAFGSAHSFGAAANVNALQMMTTCIRRPHKPNQ